MSTKRYYALTEALASITFQVPFIGCLLYDRMEIHTVDVSPGGSPNPTMATDGKRIYINRKYFEGFVTEYRMAAISHEVLHAMFFHPAKMVQYQMNGLQGRPFNPTQFNVAADLIINAMLKRCKLGAIHPEWLWSKLVTADDRVEDIYARLTPPDSSEGGGGKWTLKSADGCQKEELDVAAGGSQDTHIPARPEISEIEWKTAVAGAAMAAKSMGKLHGELARLVGEFVEPKMNWMEILRDSIMVRAGFDSINWMRYHKRKMFESRMCVPTRQSWDIPLVAIIEDCSGSISDKELATFRGAMAEILTQVKPRETILMSVSTRVNNHSIVYDIEDMNDFSANGGGGTNMEAGFTWLVANGYEPDVVIVLTDGYTRFTEAPDFPVTWVSTGKAVGSYPYGTAVFMGAPE